MFTKWTMIGRWNNTTIFKTMVKNPYLVEQKSCSTKIPRELGTTKGMEATTVIRTTRTIEGGRKIEDAIRYHHRQFHFTCGTRHS